MLIALVMILILALGCNRQGVKLSQNKEGVEIVKFLAALCVVNGHLFGFSYPNEFLRQEMNIGALCVSLFFMLSAYGLIYSYKTKTGYLDNFLRSRYSKLLVPFITAYVFSLIVYTVCRGPINWTNVLSTLAWGGPYMKYSWYVTEIAVVYMLFFLAFKIGKTYRQKFILLCILILTVMISLMIMRQPSWYIISLPAFIIGMLLAQYEELICRIKANGAVILGICIAIAMAIFIKWADISILSGISWLGKYRYAYAALFASNILFAVIMAIILSRTKCHRLPPPKFRVSHCFYEIYLLQNSAIIIAKEFCQSFWCTWCMTFATVIFLAVIFHYINQKILKLLFR